MMNITVKDFIIKGKSKSLKHFNKFSIDTEGYLLFNNLIYFPFVLRIKVLKLYHDSV